MPPNLLQFMQAELERVPERYRHAAEFEEFDASYGDESFNSRLFLSYARLETEEELADRLAKAKFAGTRIVHNGGCTAITCDGVVRVRFGNLDQSEPEQPEPLKVDGDQVYISEALIQDGIIKSPWPAAWSVRMQLGETKLGQELKEQVDLLGSNLDDRVKSLIRKELMPGGLLHRSR